MEHQNIFTVVLHSSIIYLFIYFDSEVKGWAIIQYYGL